MASSVATPPADGHHSQPTLRALPSPAHASRSIDGKIQLIHRCGRRLRLRLSSASNHGPQLAQWLNGQAAVCSARANGLTQSLVVHLHDSSATWTASDVQAWLEALPLPGDERLEEVSSIAPLNEPTDESSEQDEEPFVPSRIVLPISSLTLALLAGPLSLPPLAVAAFILVAARLSFKRAWEGWRDERRINVDALDALAVLIHSLEGFLVGPALMISMIEGGEAVRDATQRIAHSASTDLLSSLQADVRRLSDSGHEEIIPSSEVQPGDRLMFYPGDSIPVDGEVVKGEVSFDVVKLTGESVPRHAEAGDEVLAGFILLEGTLTMSATAVGNDTRIGQITAMIDSAPVFDTRVGNVAARIANRFVMPTLALAGVSLFLSAGNLAQAASLLMFDLGTGLRVSVPTAIMAALTRAGSQGLLIRSGRSLELLNDVDVVVFDKTGTLTQGHPSVVHLDVLDSRFSRQRLVQLAASAEQGLNHPIAEAIIQFGVNAEIEALSPEAWDYRIGRGVVAMIDGHQVLIGNARLLREEGLVEPALPNREELNASTPVYLAIDGAMAGVFHAADELRPDSKALVQELHRRGIEAHMLTGDVSSVAHAVAARLGLYPEEVHAEALPDQKAELVKTFKEQGRRVVFVGDGINDSAALAYADVSVSFASGSDLARETADIVLTNDKVSGLLVAQDLSRYTFQLIRQNIGIVGVPNLSALVIGTFFPLGPVAAVLINNGSSLVAAANAMRTLQFRPAPLPELDSENIRPKRNHSPKTAPAPVTPIQNTPHLQPLRASELALRLGTSHQQLSSVRRRGGLRSWSQEKDPEGRIWTYCERTRVYSSEEQAIA